MSDWTTPVAALLGGGVAAGAAWLTARRNTSGSVRTSEAQILWEQSQQMRQELVDRVNALQKQLDTTKENCDTCRHELTVAQREMAAQQSRIQALGDELAEAQEMAARLYRQLQAVDKRTADAHSDVAALKQEFTLMAGGGAG